MLQNSPPKDQQVRTVILENIRSGKFLPGGRIPSEDSLAEELNVSRATIRSALASLEFEGFVSRRQGDGTYVNQKAVGIFAFLGNHWEFTKQIEAMGQHAEVQIVGALRRPASASEASMLQIHAGQEVVESRRLFLADHEPVMLSLNILPAAYLKDDVAAGSVTEPMTDFLQRCCGKKAGYAIADFMARDADDEVARLLNVPRGTPVVELDEVFHDEGGVPLVLAQNIYQGRHLRFRIIGWGISTVW